MNNCRPIGTLVLLTAVSPFVLAQKPAEAPKPAAGGAETYQIDPVHSSNCFRIKHLNVAFFYGRFNEVAGTFIFNETDPAACSFDVHVKTDSIDTHNADRDKHLKSAEFFDVEKFPEITFKSTAVKKTGDQTYEVKGDLTLRGVTKPLTAKLNHTGAGPGMKGEYRRGWETTFEIKRREFGMSTLPNALGDEVRLTFSVEGIRQ